MNFVSQHSLRLCVPLFSSVGVASITGSTLPAPTWATTPTCFPTSFSLLYKRPRSSVHCQIVVYTQAVSLTAKPTSSVHVRWLPVCDLFRHFSRDVTFVAPLHTTLFSVLGQTPFISPLPVQTIMNHKRHLLNASLGFPQNLPTPKRPSISNYSKNVNDDNLLNRETW